MSVYYNEFNPYAAAWLRNLIRDGLIAPGEVDERSIEDVAPDDLRGFSQCHFFAGIGGWSYALRRAGWPDDKPIWTGSCPCQPFSAAGKGGGFADERHLWPAFFHLILERQPDIVMGEQVSSKDGLAWFDLVRSDLEGSGYAIGAQDTCSAGVGAPHIRQRLYWGAVRLADSCGARLEGRDAREVGREREAIERGGGAGGVAITNGRNTGTERQQRGWQQRQQPQDGGVGGLADTNRQRRDGVHPLLRQDPAGWDQGNLPEVTGRGEAMRPSPTNGFWSNPDWLFCRDDKWRPVEPAHVVMAHGVPARVDSSGADQSRSEESARLQSVRETACAQGVERQKGRQKTVRGSYVLRSSVHGSGLRGDNKDPEPQSKSPSIGEDSIGKLPELRQKRNPARSSYRPRPDEQFARQLDDIVPFLSSSLSLAKLRERWTDAEALSALRQAICEKSPLLHPHDSPEEVWASLGEEEKNRLRVGFDAGRWVIVRPAPLIDGSGFKPNSGSPNAGKSRQEILRGIGNAINVEHAAEVIRAFMEVVD